MYLNGGSLHISAESRLFSSRSLLVRRLHCLKLHNTTMTPMTLRLHREELSDAIVAAFI